MIIAMNFSQGANTKLSYRLSFQLKAIRKKWFIKRFYGLNKLSAIDFPRFLLIPNGTGPYCISGDYGKKGLENANTKATVG